MKVIIDDAANGGSEAGSWARAIRDTPALAAQVLEIARDEGPDVARDGEAGSVPPRSVSPEAWRPS